jgi:hypothetical protein
LLQIPKSTYARYEDGSAKIPADIQRKVIEAHLKDRRWMKELKKKIEADIDRKYPFGFMSLPREGM